MLGATVLDTDVVVAAVRSDRGASRVLFVAALEGCYPVLASVPLIGVRMERSVHMGRSSLAFAVLVALSVVPTPARAQATIVGVVKDASGNAIPGVFVEAQGDGPERKRQAVTNERGAFSIPGVPSGKYTLTFVLSGFDIGDINDVSVSDGTTAVTAIARIDEGCAAYRQRGSCLTNRQVAADVPEPFRPLWDSSIHDVAAVQARLPCNSISLRVRGGLLFTAGSRFTLTLYRDGRAELTSSDRMDEDTVYTGAVQVSDYGRLCYLTQRVGFGGLAQRYAANWTDAGDMTISVESEGRTVDVYEYSGMGPIELWAVEKAIEAIKTDIEWKRR